MKVLLFIAIAAFVCQANAFLESEVAVKDPGVVCDDCKVMVQDIKNLIQSDQSKNTTTTAILNLVCGEPCTTPVYGFCSNVVTSVVPLAIQALADMINPEETCISWFLCPPPNGHDQELKFRPSVASAFMKKITQHLKLH